jgi:hypothetical protein
MPGLDPGIHVLLCFDCTQASKTWMAGTSPAMTKDEIILPPSLENARCISGHGVASEAKCKPS